MIHQCLFGYSEGHELLATSVPLTREQRTLLSQLTDLSGPEPVQGFDGYLSGFPIPGGLYALSRTWYATELPRPGCVWTHSLLLDQAALALREIRHLAHLHVRPRLPEGLDGYTTGVNDIASNQQPPESADRQELLLVLNALYSPPSRRVCVAAEANTQAEAVFLAVWNQQWPQLRSSFSFTTGMLGGGQWPFDLQAIPQKNRRLFQAADTFVMVEASSEPVSEAFGDIAVDDAVAKQPKPLRSLLWTYGKDFSDAREAFRSLGDLCGLLIASDKHQRAIKAYEYVTTHFGNSPESEHLRQTLFESVAFFDPADALEVAIRDSEGVLGVSGTQVRKAALALDIAALGQLTLRLIETDGLNEARLRGLVGAFAERCPESMLTNLPPPLIAAVLIGREDVARNPNTWHQSDDVNRQVLEHINASNGFTPAIAFGLLQTANLRLLYDAKALPPESWIDAIDSLVSVAPLSPPVEEFALGLLWNSRDVVSSHLESHAFGTFIKLAAGVLDVSTRGASAFPFSNFHSQAPLPELHDGSAELHACAFLLMICLVRPEPDVAALAPQSFSKIYWAAKRQQLPWDLWKGLEVQLPWHLFEWDRCARLIEGMVSRFVNRGWPAAQFIRTFRTDEEFERAIRAALLMHGASYVESLTTAVSDDGTAFQRDRFSQLRS